MDLSLVAFALAVVAVVGVLRWLSRPHTVIALAQGRAELVRGSPPSGLLQEVAKVARHAPSASGRVELTGSGRRLKVEVHGVEARVEQQLRNVVSTYRDRIR